MTAAGLLVRVLAEPSRARSLEAGGWQALLAAARAEQLLGSLARRLEEVPGPALPILEEARTRDEAQRRHALWEAEMCRRALAPLGIPVVLLKGTAYHAAGLDAASGRSVGDLDILVPNERIGEVETALLAAGWEWVKPDPYDDLYYRRWMHELPPMIHAERDRMIDVHHTILPLTARARPDAAALIEASVPLADGLRVLAPEDMVIHAAAHLIADGELDGGLRNLWDIDRLVREFAREPGFWDRLAEHGRLHELAPDVARALRLAAALYGTPVPASARGQAKVTDAWFRRRLLARDGWGQPTRRSLRSAFYLRSHWMRMPPMMLARHLWVKARRQSRLNAGSSPA